MTAARTPIKFGTDGWRAVIAREYTFENLERVAQAYADYLIQDRNAPPYVIVGYDRRFLSELFAQRAAEVFAGNNLHVSLFNEATPT
ncbi:MAG TPA: phosphoglucomutase/phosphomannomutase family protein, partial [Pyrinomonadaceae bacterium]